MVRTSAICASRISPAKPQALEDDVEGIQPHGIEVLGACYVEGDGLVVLGPGDGGYQVVCGGQLGFVGVR